MSTTTTRKPRARKSTAQVVAEVVTPSVLSAVSVGKLDETAQRILSGFAPAIHEDAETLRTLDESQKVTRMNLGRTLGKAYDALQSLKTDDEVIRECLIAEAGNAPKTGAPYQWGTLSGMINGARIADEVRKSNPVLAESLGIDLALALKPLPDEKERLSFFQSHMESENPSLDPKVVRSLVSEHAINKGWKDAPTVANAKKETRAINKWEDSEAFKTLGSALQGFFPVDEDGKIGDTLPATVTDALEAMVNLTACVVQKKETPDAWNVNAAMALVGKVVPVVAESK